MKKFTLPILVLALLLASGLTAQKLYNGWFLVPEVSAPTTPASGLVAIYAKSDGLLYSKDDAGTETLVSGGAGGGVGGLFTHYIPFSTNDGSARQYDLNDMTGVAALTSAFRAGTEGLYPYASFVDTTDSGGSWRVQIPPGLDLTSWKVDVEFSNGSSACATGTVDMEVRCGCQADANTDPSWVTTAINVDPDGSGRGSYDTWIETFALDLSTQCSGVTRAVQCTIRRDADDATNDTCTGGQPVSGALIYAEYQ